MNRTFERLLPAVVLAVLSCTSVPPPPPAPPVTITVIGVNDTHGALTQMPLLGGYMDVIRSQRVEDGGAMFLVDAGDVFQGTLESNLNEGSAMIDAYAALGVDVMTIGNHEFDFGPAGPAVTAKSASDDPRGALLARAAQARGAGFTMVSSNILEKATGRRVNWPDVPASTMIERGGVRAGIIGIVTAELLEVTLAAHVTDLAVRPLADAVVEEARNLRARGVDLVIVTAHAGGRCTDFTSPDDLSTCEPASEIFELARAIPAGAVDLIIAGHVHAGIAHSVNGIPIISSYSRGQAFGRVDFTFDRAKRVVGATKIHPPRQLCAANAKPCDPGSYEGVTIAPDPDVAAAIAPALEAARETRERSLGVTVTAPITRSRDEESSLGNLFTDLMREARPQGDLAVANGGGLRAAIPAGDLTYGSMYEAMPFDNRFALMRMTGAQFRHVVASGLAGKNGFLSISGVRATARCEAGAVAVDLVREDGRPIRDEEPLVVVASDFLATGGDAFFNAVDLPKDAVTIEDDSIIREEMVDILVRRGGTLDPATLLDPQRPRVVRCD